MSDAELFEDEAAVGEFKALMADPASRQAFVELKHRAAESGATRRYAHVLRAVSETPWAIRLPMLGIIVDLLAYRAAGGTLTQEEIEARVSAARRQPAMSPGGGVAVIPLHGVIMPKASMMSEMSGGTSVESFRQNFRQAMASPDISSVVIDVDSPGGMVDGVPELASEIRAARGTKPIMAVANTEAASAAYWLASQADKLYVTKSGRVGSIGVYTSHEDESQRADNLGVKTTLVSAGKYKTEGNPFEPLSEEAKANLQSMVDDYYAMFVTDVARGRKVSAQDVKDGYGEGRVMQAKAALKAGMVDGIATTEEVVRAFLQDAQQKAAAMSYTTLPTQVTSSTSNSATTVSPINYVLGSSSVEETSEDDFAFVARDLTEDDKDEELRDAVIAAAKDNHDSNEPMVVTDNMARLLGLDVKAAVDTSAWDGNAAMGMCNGASDYAEICAAEHTIGTRDQRQHWALPHHYPGKGCNAKGVAAAVGRIDQTQNITDEQRTRARNHLAAHQTEIKNANAAEGDEQFFILDPDQELLADLATLRDES